MPEARLVFRRKYNQPAAKKPRVERVSTRARECERGHIDNSEDGECLRNTAASVQPEHLDNASCNGCNGRQESDRNDESEDCPYENHEPRRSRHEAFRQVPQNYGRYAESENQQPHALPLTGK